MVCWAESSCKTLTAFFTLILMLFGLVNHSAKYTNKHRCKTHWWSMIIIRVLDPPIFEFSTQWTSLNRYKTQSEWIRRAWIFWTLTSNLYRRLTVFREFSYKSLQSVCVFLSTSGFNNKHCIIDFTDHVCPYNVNYFGSPHIFLRVIWIYLHLNELVAYFLNH